MQPEFETLPQLGPKEPTHKVGRRQFLAGAAYAVGAASLAMSMPEQDARAATVAANGVPELIVGYVEGERLVPVDRIDGDRSLVGTTLRLTVGPRNAGRTFASLDAHFPQDAGGHALFHAWHKSAASAVFTMPVAADGIRLSVNIDGAEVPCNLHPGALKAGAYVLATSHALTVVAEEDGRLVLHERTLGGPVPARFDHIFLTVERA